MVLRGPILHTVPSARALLDGLLRDRDELDTAIRIVAAKLGESAGPLVIVPGGNGAPPEAREVGPVAVTEGEFFGMATTKAVRLVLDKAGRSRPLKTDELFALVKRGGLQLNGKNARSTFLRTLRNDRAFLKLPTGQWGLKAWYPGGVVASTRRPVRTGSQSGASGDIESQPADDDGEGEPTEDQ